MMVCDLCGERIKGFEEERRGRKHYVMDRSFNGVDTSDDCLLTDLCDGCELKIHKAFFRKLKKDGVVRMSQLVTLSGGKLATLDEHAGCLHRLVKDRTVDRYDFGMFVKDKYWKKLDPWGK